MGIFDNLDLEIFGASHSERIGVSLSVPLGTRLTLKEVDSLLDRRRGGQNAWSTPRKEEDIPRYLDGLRPDGDGYIVAGKIEAYIENKSVRRSDYDLSVPRPSHADYAAYMRDGRIESGGGRFSGRMTAPLCIAGGIAKEILMQRGIDVCGYLSSVGGLRLKSYRDGDIDIEELKAASGKAIPALDGEEKVAEYLTKTASEGDSVGGTVDIVISGLKAGEIGDAMFDGFDGKLAYAIFGVPAVKGVEFGDGFDITKKKGSEANDEMRYVGSDVVCLSNHSGGITGGITNGMNVTLRVAIKPTPSIFKPQRSVDLESGEDATLTIKGRHDSCIAIRAIPAIESAAALATLDMLLDNADK